VKIDILVPQEFPQDSQVRVVRWLRRHGEPIKKNEDLVELEFSKAAITLSASTDGIVAIKETAGSWLSPGASLGWIQSPDELLENPLRSARVSSYLGQETSTLMVHLDADEILASMDSLHIQRKKLLPILLHEVFQYFSEASEFHQVWRVEGYTKAEKALIGMAFFSSRQVLIYPYEGPTLSIANIERWILKSAINAQKEQPAKQSVTLTITSLIDQDIVTFTPLLARGQAFTLGIGGDLHCRRPSISFQGSFDARALKGLHVAKTLQALKIKIQNLKDRDKLKKFLE
jgi:pyruvate/2-oxoglutarate dehydrogenase complex dihydrolipoamide acyltransferase (E2) component